MTPSLPPGVSTVLVEEGCAEPVAWSEAIAAAERELTVVAGLVLEPPAYLDAILAGRVRCRTPMPGRGLAVAAGRVEALPLGYADCARAWHEGFLDADAVAVSVTAAGTLGVQWGYVLEAADVVRRCGGVLLVERNSAMPDVAGAPNVDLSGALVVDSHRPLVELRTRPPSAVDRSIAEHVATLVPSGACLAIGIGGLGDAVYAAVTAAGRRHLSFHSGMLGDSVASLADSGALAPSTPLGDPPLSTSALIGSNALAAWAAAHPSVRLHPSSHIHAPRVTSTIHGFCAISFALEVDLVGNVGAESVEGRVLSGPGGQLDFAIGACAAPGGRSIVALPSTTARGTSRIVARLSGQTTTPAARVHYVVTEHGVAELGGSSTAERAAALVSVAAPEHRASLQEELESLDPGRTQGRRPGHL